MITGTHRIQRVGSPEEAARIVEFFFSQESFDDTRHTPGEEEHFKTLPYRAMLGEAAFWYATDESGEILGINCIAENEQRTGGYDWDYIVVRRGRRNEGVAASLIETMFAYLRQIGARYVVTYTCDLPPYETIRRQFVRYGFTLSGRLPDYYYDGEDRLIYYRKLT